MWARQTQGRSVRLWERATSNCWSCEEFPRNHTPPIPNSIKTDIDLEPPRRVQPAHLRVPKVRRNKTRHTVRSTFSVSRSSERKWRFAIISKNERIPLHHVDISGCRAVCCNEVIESGRCSIEYFRTESIQPGVKNLDSRRKKS